jgi:hypothetical protein
MVAWWHTCNPSYGGGIDRRSRSKASLSKISRSIWKITEVKKGYRCYSNGRELPSKFKPQYCQDFCNRQWLLSSCLTSQMHTYCSPRVLSVRWNMGLTPSCLCNMVMRLNWLCGRWSVLPDCWCGVWPHELLGLRDVTEDDLRRGIKGPVCSGVNSLLFGAPQETCPPGSCPSETRRNTRTADASQPATWCQWSWSSGNLQTKEWERSCEVTALRSHCGWGIVCVPLLRWLIDTTLFWNSGPVFCDNPCFFFQLFPGSCL